MLTDQAVKDLGLTDTEHEDTIILRTGSNYLPADMP